MTDELDELEKKLRFSIEYSKSVSNAVSYIIAARKLASSESWEPAHNILRLAIEELQAANDMVFDAKLSEKEGDA